MWLLIRLASELLHPPWAVFVLVFLDLSLSSKWICSVKCWGWWLWADGWTLALCGAWSQNANDTINQQNRSLSHAKIISWYVLFTNPPSQSWKGLLKVSSQCRYLSLSLGLGRSFSRSRTDSNPRPIWYFSSTSIFICGHCISLAWTQNYYQISCFRFTPRAVIWRLTRGPTPERSLISAAGRDVIGSLPDPMSWLDITANTPGVNPSNVTFVTELSPGVITWAYTWRDTRQFLDDDML